MRIKRITSKKDTSRERGLSLVEIVVACAVISLTLVSLIAVTSQSIALSKRSVSTYQAGLLLEEGAEVVRIVRDNAWSNISGLSAGTNYYPTLFGSVWSLSTTPTTIDGFTRTVTVAAVTRDANDDIAVSGTADAGTRLVTVTVSWQEGATPVSKTLQIYVSDIFS